MFTRLVDNGHAHHPTPGNTADDLDTVMPGPHLSASSAAHHSPWPGGMLSRSLEGSTANVAADSTRELHCGRWWGNQTSRSSCAPSKSSTNTLAT